MTTMVNTTVGTCTRCGASFPEGSNPRRVYCSVRCRSAAQYLKVAKTLTPAATHCLNCNSVLPEQRDKRKQFCSAGCRQKHRTALAETCPEDGCSRPIQARGLCITHYQRNRMAGEYGKTCSETDCDRGMFARNLCTMHYYRKARRGEFGAALAERDQERTASRRYGLKRGGYAQLLAEQNGVCAICSAPPTPTRRLHVDHDHLTGAVRALLCGNCNRGLGYLRDDPVRLRAAAEYIEKFQEVPA